MWRYSILIFFLATSRHSNGQTCPNNQYNQNQQTDYSTCSVWRNYNIKTFDDHGINFGSKCTFTLTTFKLPDGSQFQIDAGVSSNCKETESCPIATTMTYNNIKYTLDLDEAGLATCSSGDKSYPIPSDNNGINIYRRGDKVIVEFTNTGVSVKWNKKSVEVAIGNKKKYEILGLCGNNDQCSTNDQKLMNGQDTNDLDKFLKEWQADTGSCTSSIQTQSSCRYNMPKATQSCKVLTERRFQEAQQVLKPDLYVEACTWSYCDCQEADPMSCLCDTFEAYARAAINAGAKKVHWRDGADGKLCYPTCPGDLLYFPCAPSGGRQTCDSVITNGEQNQGKCEEGCYCTANTYLYEDTCYIKKRCPCSSEGTTIQPGGTVKISCRTCTCTDGITVCPTEPCVTIEGHCCLDPHFKTWDGRYYNFMGKCEYYLVNANNFKIISDHYVYKDGKLIKEFSDAPSYAGRIILEMDGQVLEFKSNLEVVVNNVVIKYLPYWAGSILITKPSSLFVLAELPNGMEIQWDGFSTTVVRAPIEMEGKLRGLLGTFSENPDDDFSLPDGTEVTNPNIFGNSWKTNATCRDEPLEPGQHPCVTNPSIKPRAEKICSAITGGLFKNCGVAELQIFYDNCIYDVCNCKDNPEPCACDHMATIADKCMRNGVIVDWRKNVTECAVTCPAGEVFQVCGDSCSRTCDDLSFRPNCEKECVEGCNCPPGNSLDEEGKCIAVEKCKCKLNGVYFPSNFQILKSSHELLTCRSGRWVSSVPINSEQNNIPSEEDLRRKCNKWEFTQYTACLPGVQETCQNMHDYRIVAPQECLEGCQCVNGYVLNTVTRTCVKPVQCPCFYNGRSYEEGNVIDQNGGKECTCKGGAWVCKDIPQGCLEGDTKIIDDKKCVCNNNNWECTKPHCAIWGDSHIKRFDGLRIDFQGECSYILAEGSLNGNVFSIVLVNEICSHTGATCLKSIILSITADKISESITLIKNGELPSTKGYQKITVTDKYLFVEVEVAVIGLKLMFDFNTWVSIRLDDDVWRKDVSGLCGIFDRQHINAPVSNNEQILNFVDICRVDLQCPKSRPKGDQCDATRRIWAVSACGVLQGPIFAPCHSKVPVETYYDVCISDSCRCDIGGDCECLCTAIKVYAQQCNDYGVPIKWRSQKRCPVQCPDNTRYDPCVSACPPRTCDTLHQGECEDQLCTEGCAPPPLSPEYVYLDDSFQIVVEESNCPGNLIVFDEPDTTTEKPGIITPPPEECDPNRCPQLTCPNDTIEAQIDGQCCKSCQHKTKCIVRGENGDILLKEPGETWTEGSCKACTCVGNEDYRYCSQCTNKVCTELENKDEITEDTYYELKKGDCCSNLEPVACVYKGTIYKAGETWAVGECLSVQCVIDPQTRLPTVIHVSPKCQETCPIGFIYKKLPNFCCGYCVQDSCVYEGKARRLGEEWLSENGCISYNCELVEGQYQMYSHERMCPVIRYCSGQIRRERCCEYCDTFEMFTWRNESLRCSLNPTPI